LIQNLNGPPSIYKNGVLQTLITHYALGPTGIVTWVTPPANTVALTWSGSFYYRCKFMSDIFEESEFSSGWHAVRSLQFRSVKL
jgi:hypothetical protein